MKKEAHRPTGKQICFEHFKNHPEGTGLSDEEKMQGFEDFWEQEQKDKKSIEFWVWYASMFHYQEN